MAHPRTQGSVHTHDKNMSLVHLLNRQVPSHILSTGSYNMCASHVHCVYHLCRELARMMHETHCCFSSCVCARTMCACIMYICKQSSPLYYCYVRTFLHLSSAFLLFLSLLTWAGIIVLQAIWPSVRNFPLFTIA